MDKLRNFVESLKLYQKISANKYLSKLVNWETISYVFFGFMSTAVAFISYAIFLKIYAACEWQGLLRFFSSKPDSLAYLDANALSWILSVIFSFAVNKHFVFKSREVKNRAVAREFRDFTATRLFSLLVEQGLIYLCVSIFEVGEILAKLLVAVIVLVLNYLTGKLVVFKKKGSSERN